MKIYTRGLLALASLSADFLSHCLQVLRFKESSKRKTGSKLIRAQLSKKTQVTPFLPQAPGRANTISDYSLSPGHAGCAGLSLLLQRTQLF
jgi:hypothetical protein